MKKSSIPWAGNIGHPMLAWQESINDMFENFFDNWPSRETGNLQAFKGAFSPSINVEDQPEALLVTAEVPGLKEEDLDIQLADKQLLICGHKREDYNSEERGVKYVGRSYGEFKRVIPLNFEPQESKINASLEKGVLRIVIPKGQAERPKSIKLNVKSA